MFTVICLFSFFDQSAVLAQHTGDEELSEKQIQFSDLPAAVRQAVQEGYGACKVKEVDEETYPDGSIAYELELKCRKRRMEVLYTPDGQLLRETDEKKRPVGKIGKKKNKDKKQKD